MHGQERVSERSKRRIQQFLTWLQHKPLITIADITTSLSCVPTELIMREISGDAFSNPSKIEKRVNEKLDLTPNGKSDPGIMTDMIIIVNMINKLCDSTDISSLPFSNCSKGSRHCANAPGMARGEAMGSLRSHGRLSYRGFT